MSRYGKSKIVDNKEDFYSEILEERDIKSIMQMETVMLHNPTVSERRQIRTNVHIWKYSDRYYKLANQYYGDPELWWIIAWYNSYPTEANVPVGAALSIPLSLEQIIQVLGL